MARPTPQNSFYDDFSGPAPSSDSDPYSSSSSSSSVSGTYNVNTTSFPKPLPILGPLFGFNETKLQEFQAKKLPLAAQGIKRPLTQEEADALTFYAAKQIKIMSYGPPIGIAGGFYRAYNTQAEFRFPFWKPDLAKFSFDAFPTNKAAVVRGLPATMMWHGLRWALYGSAGRLVGEMLIGSYAASVVIVGEMSDSRLKSYIERIRDIAQEKKGTSDGIGQGQGQGQPQRQRGMPQIPVSQAGSVVQDDASPTGGMFGQMDMTPQEESEVSKPQPQFQPRAQSQGMPRGTRPQQQQQAPAEATQAEAKPFDMFDDASPTGAQQGMMPDTQSRRPERPGSAWDRIRRGDKPPPNPKIRSPEQREYNDYAESDTKEQVRYGKDEAQKEFDAKIERERRGGDFGAGEKKW